MQVADNLYCIYPFFRQVCWRENLFSFLSLLNSWRSGHAEALRAVRPESLNSDQKRQRFQSSEQHLEFFRGDLNDFLSRLVTINETCLYHNEPETMQQSMEWRHRDSPRHKIFQVQKSARKFVASIFWYQDGICLFDYFPQSQTNSTQYYLSPPMHLKDILKYKFGGYFIKLVLLLHDNSPTHRTLSTKKKLSYLVSILLITHPILRIWPRRTATCSLDWKKIESSPFFFRRVGHCCRGDLVRRVILWVFWVSCKR